MRIKWKHLSSKEKDELIGKAVEALVELSKGEPHTVPRVSPERYYIEETSDFGFHWTVEYAYKDEPLCYCFLKEEAELIRDALNRGDT